MIRTKPLGRMALNAVVNGALGMRIRSENIDEGIVRFCANHVREGLYSPSQIDAAICSLIVAGFANGKLQPGEDSVEVDLFREALLRAFTAARGQDVPAIIGIGTHDTKRGPMREVESATIAVGQGLITDRTRSSVARQVTLLALESWKDACMEVGREIHWLVRRANLLVSGVRFDAQDPGAILQIGDVLLKVTRECEPCERMEEQVPGLEAALRPEWRGGACATVLQGGEIQLGDTLQLIRAA